MSNGWPSEFTGWAGIISDIVLDIVVLGRYTDVAEHKVLAEGGKRSLVIFISSIIMFP